MESKLGFLFYPKCKAFRAWYPIKKNIKYSDSNRKFLDFVRNELGDDPRSKTKVFLTSELIINENRHPCGIGEK